MLMFVVECSVARTSSRLGGGKSLVPYLVSLYILLILVVVFHALETGRFHDSNGVSHKMLMGVYRLINNRYIQCKIKLK
jgi:hypothetical protein